MLKRLGLAVTLATALVLPTVARAAEDAGPAKGAAPPMLHVKPFNSDAPSYCATCSAGQKPSVVAFVSKADDATKAFLTALSKQLTDHQDAHLVATVVVVAGTDADALKSYITSEKLAFPATVAEAKSLTAWKLSPDADRTVVLIKAHKVADTVAELTADGLGDAVKGILG